MKNLKRGQGALPGLASIKSKDFDMEINEILFKNSAMELILLNLLLYNRARFQMEIEEVRYWRYSHTK